MAASNKFGQCPLCPKSAPAKRLYGGLCAYHIGHPADDQSKERQSKEDKQTDHEEKLLKKYFQEQAAQRPQFCENQCGKRLIASTDWQMKAIVCHIIPKRHFKSVMVHPLNRWFGCLHCHHDYDDKGWTHAVTMPVWPVCLERFQQFMTLIRDKELRFLPDVFRDLLNPIL